MNAGEGGTPAALARAGRIRGLATALAVALLGVLLYVPSFATDELDDEEGRRAIPAREMVESGDFVLPTIWGRPYLNKPPLYFWLVAASSLATGAVDEAATRLPSVVATVLTALGVLFVGRRLGARSDRPGERTGAIAALMFLVTLAVFEKGAFGELEAVLTLTVFGATAALWFASRAAGPEGRGTRVRWSVGSGLFLAAALLTKGPPALVFFGAAVLAVALARRDARALARPWPWLALGVGAVLAGVWVLLLLARPEVGDAVAHWGGEMARADDGLARYLKTRRRFAAGVLVGFFPASFLWLASLGTDVRRRVRAEEAWRFAGWTVALALAFFALMPGTATRYVHPLVPWACLSGGRLLAAAMEREDARFARRARRLGRLVAGLGLAVVAGAAWLAFGSIRTVDHLGPLGWTFAAAALALSVAAWRAFAPGVRPAALWLALGVLASARLIQLAEVVPQSAGARGREAAGRAIARELPEGEPLFVAVPHHYNTLFYVRRRTVAVDDPRDVPSGASVVVGAGRVEALLAEPGLDARAVVTVPTHEGEELTLLRVGP